MDTITVKRANVVLDISPDQKDYYLGQGFSVVDSTGSVVEETTKLTLEALNHKIVKMQKIIDEKDAEIARLKNSQSNGGGRGRKKQEVE